MSVVPAEDLLRAVAGAAKLKRLWLQIVRNSSTQFGSLRKFPSQLRRPGTNLMENPMINAKEE